jgi:hypothetical protein
MLHTTTTHRIGQDLDSALSLQDEALVDGQADKLAHLSKCVKESSALEDDRPAYLADRHVLEQRSAPVLQVLREVVLAPLANTAHRPENSNILGPNL